MKLKMKSGWLEKEMEKNSKDVAAWPDWLKRISGRGEALVGSKKDMPYKPSEADESSEYRMAILILKGAWFGIAGHSRKGENQKDLDEIMAAIIRLEKIVEGAFK